MKLEILSHELSKPKYLENVVLSLTDKSTLFLWQSHLERDIKLTVDEGQRIILDGGLNVIVEDLLDEN